MKPIYNLDRVVLEQGVLLLQGWVVQASGGSVELWLQGRSPDGQIWRQSIDFNRPRPDVCASLKLPLAVQNCGFFYYAALPPGVLHSLRVRTDQGELDLHTWTESEGQKRVVSGASAWSLRLSAWRYLVSRAWALLRAGQWRSLQERVQRHIHSAGQILQASARGSTGLKDLVQSVDCLVIDHDLGGGANQYRRRQVQTLLDQGQSVLLLTFSVLGLRYMFYRLHPGGRQDLLLQLPWEHVLEEIEALQPAHIFYNNAVSFPQAMELIQGLATFKARHPDKQLTLTAHDYFALCPSQHLMNVEGEFCDLPALSECHSCLARSQRTMVSLYRRHGIVAWRQAWEQLLQSADQVLIFDSSAKKLFERIYPASAVPVHWMLRPHQVPALSEAETRHLHTWQAQKKAPSGRIGVVGLIESETKGVVQVQSLIEAIERSGKPYEVIVIGQLNPKPTSSNAWRETGPYKADELTEKIIAHDIDMFFFSSVGPETFSYVLHELERYQLPIAAFDLGAQASFLASYKMAIDLPLRASGSAILEKIEPYLKTGI